MMADLKPLTAAESIAMLNRIKELDRLYLLAEGAMWYNFPNGSPEAVEAHEQHVRYKGAYEQLRDSNIGLPEGYTG